MSGSGDRELGIMELSRALVTGEGISPKIAFTQAYGLYLMHGGTPEGFMQLTEDDVQTMYTSYISTLANDRRELVKDIVKILEKMLKV